MLNKLIIKIKEKIKKILENLIDKNVSKTFIDLYNLEKSYKLIWVLTLPFTAFFIFINIFVILMSFSSYSFLFVIKFIKIRIFKKKTKNIIFKKRFKFLKNFYLVNIEKILFTYPRQKGFLFFYIIYKSIYEKDKSLISKEHLPEFLKSLSNRIVVFLILSIPYVLIYCNLYLINIIKELEGFNYESKRAYFNSIILNITKSLTNNYNKLILKLKVKFYKKKIVFNSKKDLIKALYCKKEFSKNFFQSKKSLKYFMAKQKLETGKYCKAHFTAVTEFKNGKIIYVNETSKEGLSYKRYNEKVKEYVNKIYKNMYKHEGSLKTEKVAYYTPSILTEKEKMIIANPEYNNKIINLIKEEKLNNIIAAYSLNLDEFYLENVTLKEGNTDKEILIENTNLKKTIDYYKENKDYIEIEQYESMLAMDFFWKENEKIIKNLNFEEKLNLCNDLDLEYNSSLKEINFYFFNDVMNKK